MRILWKKRLVEAFLLFFFAIMNKGKPSPKPKNAYELLKQVGILKFGSLDSMTLQHHWQASESAWNEGHYLQAVRCRAEILHSIYSFHGISETSYFPPFLSSSYTSNIGHIGVMGAHLEAQRMGLIAQGPRVFIRKRNGPLKELLDCFTANYSSVTYQSGSGWGELPVNWHVSERLEMIRAHDEFIDQYELLEKVYSSRSVDKGAPILTLDAEYVDKASTYLRNLGITSEDWFVSLHVRDSRQANDQRNQDVATYIPAIRHINNIGGKVIRIGDREMEPLDLGSGFIDLSQLDSSGWLSPYVLSVALFHIGTTSGPTWIAPLFGVPVLHTNATSIGRNAHTMSKHSFTLPKTIQSSANRLSLRQMLTCHMAYSETDPTMKTKQFQYINNSETEILHATKEMMMRIQRTFSPCQEIVKNIEQVRIDTGAVGRGLLSASFLERHSDWFLG